MTPRQARRERRAAERQTKKAEIRRTKAGLPEDGITLAHHHAAEDGFVSQTSTAPVSGLDVVPQTIVLGDWLERARKRNFPNGLPGSAQPELDFVSQNAPPPAGRAAINRANAQLSSGPRTIEGKLASSRNSFKHGLASGQPIIAGEDPAAFESLRAGLLNDHQPANVTEELLVKQMAQAYWLEQRAIRLQNECFSDIGVDEKRLSLFLRYGATHNRAFHKALADLHRLQKERRNAERGFVSQSVVKNSVKRGFVRQNEPLSNLEPGFVSQTQPVESLASSRTGSKAA